MTRARLEWSLQMATALLVVVGVASLSAQETECIADISTGFDQDADAVLAEGVDDDDYSVSVGGVESPALTGGASTGFPVPTWVPNDEQSLWISNAADSNTDPGTYIYRIAIDIDDGDASELIISGRWTADDNVTDVLINGESTGLTVTGFGALSTFPRNAGLGFFQSGINDIEFVVSNGTEAANPSGLRVQACVGRPIPTVNCVANVSTGFDQAAPGRIDEGLADDDYKVDVGFGPEEVFVGGLSTGFPIGAWIPNDAASAWISNTANSTADPGLYTYEIIFDVPGTVEASKLVLSGFWAADDSAPSVTINDQVAGFTGGGFGAWSPFPPNAGLGLFQTGENVIQIQVDNGGVDPNPSGLRVDACVGTPIVIERPFNLSTGFDNTTGTLLTDGEEDPSYTMTTAVGEDPAVALAAPPCPIPPWFPNSVNARWIGPSTADCNADVGEYDFTIEVELPGDFDAASAVIEGGMTADDQVVDVIVNGESTAFASVGFDTQTPFPINFARGLLVTGTNTVTFRVLNGGVDPNPGGLLVDAEIVLGPPEVDAPPSLFSLDTGFSNELGATIADGAPDDNYVLTGPPGSDIGPTFATVVTGAPIPPWIANSAQSKWIGVEGSGSNGPPGDYTFAITVELPDTVDASQARIIGQWVSDNGGVDVRINGQSTGLATPGGFNAFSTIPADAGLGLFENGENLVEFVVNNAGDNVNPLGLRVEAVVGLSLPDATDLSTGLSTRGIGALPPGSQDRYLATGPDGSGVDLAPAVVLEDGVIPNGLANSATSQWIGLDTDGSSGPAGSYRYDVTFTLVPDANPDRLVLTGGWAAATSGLDVELNGVSIAATASGPENLTAFPDGAGRGLFQVGENTLSFFVDNAAEGPTGLRVEARYEAVVEANPLDISTGFDQDAGVPLEDEALDEDYEVTTVDLEIIEASAYNAAVLPAPPWIFNSGSSRWIGPIPTDTNNVPGEYRYQTTVTLSADEAEVAYLSGVWAADDGGNDMLINEVSTGATTAAGFVAYTALPPELGRGLFVEGQNTIEFVVSNGGEAGNPTGLRVDAVVVADVEPGGGLVFRRGDTDGNGALEVTDPINNLSFQFLGTFTPPCKDAADFDDNGKVEITDPIANLSHQFLGQSPPAAPGKENCGVDPTDDDGNGNGTPGEPDDDLGCEMYPAENAPPEAACD